MGGYYGWSLYEFDEERDTNAYRVWIWDKKESYATFSPFEVGWMLVGQGGNHGMPYACETLSIPACKGATWRTRDSWVWVTVMETTNEEQKKREPIFREQIAPWIEDFGEEWRKYIDELMGHYERLKAADVQKLSDIELREHFQDWLSVYRRSWELHMVAMYSSSYIFMLFEDMCKELLGIDAHDPLFGKLVSGFENRVWQTDRGLWRLAERARGLGLEQLFLTIQDDDQLLSELGHSEAGGQWLQELHEFLQEDGWRMPTNYIVSVPSWVEKPSLALPDIRRAMAKGGIFVLDQQRVRLVEEREGAEKEVLARVSEDRREWFDKLMRSAQWNSPWNEEHAFYCEDYVNALGRRVTKEIGDRFAQAGVIDGPQDIYCLMPDEIDFQLIPKLDVRPLVRRRREQHEAYRKSEPEPPFLGDPAVIPEVVVKDPILATRVLAMPRVRPELKADLYGSASAPGVAEGVARVIRSQEEFDQVQPGDIMITVETNPVWTPLFGIVGGVVTDAAGLLSHAVIVGREYGIPVVGGTQEATTKIKSGMRIRVDGDTGAVYILS